VITAIQIILGIYTPRGKVFKIFHRDLLRSSALLALANFLSLLRVSATLLERKISPPKN